MLTTVTSEGTLSASSDMLVLGVVSRGVVTLPSMSDSAPLSRDLLICRGGEGWGVFSLEFSKGVAGTIKGCRDSIPRGGGLETAVCVCVCVHVCLYTYTLQMWVSQTS